MIDGILPVNKPRGISSARAVAKLKSIYGAKKAGHGGALDPLADGLLVVLFGAATGFARFSLGADKTYRAAVKFGMQTETDDSEGAAVFASSPPPDLAERVRELLPHFVGRISQTAPQYSALKHKGEPLYKKARRGESVAAKTRELQVESISIAEVINKGEGIITFDIRAQSGFYVRAFARDIGKMVGCGAHLWSLTRTASGVFSLSDAAPLNDLTDKPQCQRLSPPLPLLPIERALTFLPKSTLPLDIIAKMAHGQKPVINNINNDNAVIIDKKGEDENNGEQPIRIYSPGGRFAGIASGIPPKPIRFLQWTRTEITPGK